MMQRVLVTGAGGFIGSHLVEALLQKGTSVNAMVSYTSAESNGLIERLPADLQKNIEIFRGDIRERSVLAQAMKGVDAVVHLAGLAAVPYSFDAPDSYVSTNLVGTFNVLEEARREPGKRILLASTAAVYGKPNYLPLDEKHPTVARSPYAASKLSAERFAESYFHSYGERITTVRPFNTYGPRQSARAIVPSMIQQMTSGQDKIMVGDLQPTRDLVYVADMVEGFLKLLDCDAASGREINICTGVETRIGDLVQTIKDVTGSTAEIVVDPARCRLKEGEEDRIYGDNSLLAELTGWKPGTCLADGLKRTVAAFS